MGNSADAGSGQGGLDSLSIAGFRGIDQLDIPHLGRVALLAGRNGVGKTTVLEALRVYAARGRPETLGEVLSHREELTTVHDEEGGRDSAPALDRLFHRNGGVSSTVTIGPVNDVPQLTIYLAYELSDSLENVEEVKVLTVMFDEVERRLYPWSNNNRHRLWRPQSHDVEGSVAPIRCESLGPGPMSSTSLATLWDKVALTDDEAISLEAVRLVFGDRVKGIAAIGDDFQRHGRRMMTKLANHANPMPLRSLGDGATRMFGVALALANCRDGILLIDEVENGIHYSLQRKFWGMVLRTAKAHNTQVVATTHSKDCINGFAAAALACPNIDANLVRIGRHNGKLRAVDYSIEELETAAEQNIEVR